MTQRIDLDLELMKVIRNHKYSSCRSRRSKVHSSRTRQTDIQRDRCDQTYYHAAFTGGNYTAGIITVQLTTCNIVRQLSYEFYTVGRVKEATVIDSLTTGRRIWRPVMTIWRISALVQSQTCRPTNGAWQQSTMCGLRVCSLSQTEQTDKHLRRQLWSVVSNTFCSLFFCNLALHLAPKPATRLHLNN